MEAKVILWPRLTAKNDYILKLRITNGKELKFYPFDFFRVIPDPKTPIIDKSRETTKTVEAKLNTDCLLWDLRRQVLSEVSKPRKPNDVKQAEYDRYVNAKGLVDAIEAKYQKVIDPLSKEGRNVTIDQLVQMVENPVKQTTVHSYFKLLVGRFKVAQKIGQSTVYKSTLDSIKKFQSTDMKFHDIDLHFLKRYENHLREKGLKDTTISLYFRTLRAVYNSAIGEGFAKQTDYPFGKRSDNSTFTVSKFDDQTRKRAISKDELQSIIDAMLEPDQEFAREIFLFSYYAAGINFGDMAKLTWRNFDGTRINYTRTKTHVKISTFLLPYCKNIIQRQRLRTGIDQDNYIFEILNQHIHKTPQQIQNRIHKVLGQVNQTLKEIAKTTKIKDIVSTYTARHSFITHAAQSGEITPFDLQMMVGHSDIKTTMIYFQDSSQDKKDLLMQKIIGM